jgi:uncharacterized protein YyaL (SSP411 family)
MAYTETFQATRKEEFAQTAREIITYVSRELTSTKGGFLSAEDADSEGEEGKYYLWTEEQLSQTLPVNMPELMRKVFNVERTGNYEEITTGESSGKNILFLGKTMAEIAGDLGIPLPDLLRLVEKMREDLLAVRSKRVRPNKDDKILADWNGLMIAALAKSARVFDEPKFAAAAKNAADFIIKNMVDTEGRLYHRYRDGEAAISGFLDDYAFFVWGLIELYETVFDAKYLKLAVEFTERMLLYFWDNQQGGFYQIASFSEFALTRNKEIHDGAYPSGNSVAALDLIRLARMTGETRYEEKANELLQAFSADVIRLPSAHSHMMSALDFALGPSSEVVIAGALESEDTKKMLRTLESRFVPRKVVLLRRPGKEYDEIVDVAKFSENLVSVDGKTTVYVCKAYVCNLPTADAEVMLEQVDQ